MDFDFRHLALLPERFRVREEENMVYPTRHCPSGTGIRVAVYDRLAECGEDTLPYHRVIAEGGEPLLALMLDLDMGD